MSMSTMSTTSMGAPAAAAAAGSSGPVESGKNGASKTKYCIRWETHATNVFRGFCSLMEHQSLVDVVLCCGSNTIQAHKAVLAANSPMFREEFEKNPGVEQVMVQGCEFTVVRSAVEVMYCGRTVVGEESVRHFVAVARLFQLRVLDSLFLERPDFLAQAGEELVLPRPQFLTRRPKYPTYGAGGAAPAPAPLAPALAATPVKLPAAAQRPVLLPVAQPPPQPRHKPQQQPAGGKQLQLRLEAEQACAKEAHASRMALASLQKEIAAAPQVNSFVIEESCTETTVENFIPSCGATAAPADHRLQQPRFVQVVEVEEVPMAVPCRGVGVGGQAQQQQGATAAAAGAALSGERVRRLLGADLPANVEVMYKTGDGSFVAVTEEVLRALACKEGLQYQVVDEDGRVGEIQDLRLQQLAQPPTPQLLADAATAPASSSAADAKFSPDIFFADLHDHDQIADADVPPVALVAKIEAVDDSA